MKNQKIMSYVHAFLIVLLAAFFIYAGTQKFIPKKHPPRDNSELVLQVQQERYEPPHALMLVVKSMKVNGMLYVIGLFQILAGFFMLIPRTRLLGLAILLPVIANIFLLHVFLDNRPGEVVETGILLGLTLLLILWYYKRLQLIFVKKAI